VYTEISSWRIPAAADTPGFQVDLLIDRRDACIHLCEIKHHAGPITLTRADAVRLIALKQRFWEYTGTSKQVFITCITNYPLKENSWSREAVDVAICLDDLLLFISK
jgi:uncharacterized protein